MDLAAMVTGERCSGGTANGGDKLRSDGRWQSRFSRCGNGGNMNGGSGGTGERW